MRQLLLSLAFIARLLPPSASDAQETHTFFARLNGGEVISPQGQGNAGDPNLSGVAVLDFTLANPLHVEFCIWLALDTTLDVTAVHLHEAFAPTNGPVLIEFPATTARSCVTISPEQWLVDLTLYPNAFSIDVHTTDYPNGAVRGQLDH